MPLTRALGALILLLSILLAHPSALAQTTPPSPHTDVTVGMYVVQLDDPSLKDRQFTAVFWLWFRWKGDKDLNPLKKFEVVGGQVEGLENEETVVGGEGGVHYQCAKVRARITQEFDVTRFPIDDHTLEISVEETSDGIEVIRYVPDARNSKLQESIALAGWRIGTTAAVVATHNYASTFGDPAQPEDGKSSYARFTLQVPVDRPGIGYPIKMFWSLYLSVFVAILAFNIKPIDLDPRFGLGVGAVFAAMASAYVISSSLPDGNQVTLADKVVMIAIGFIVTSIIQSIISLRLFQAGKEAACARLDRLSFFVFTLAYAGINVWLLRAA
ncbi:MAG TPA: hypothetical protein VD997_14625 [Phycisphaerales bacterium]|nr:hypothetical protein [Phycisphaerales bacterium]